MILVSKVIKHRNSKDLYRIIKFNLFVWIFNTKLHFNLLKVLKPQNQNLKAIEPIKKNSFRFAVSYVLPMRTLLLTCKYSDFFHRGVLRKILFFHILHDHNEHILCRIFTQFGQIVQGIHSNHFSSWQYYHNSNC